MLPSSLLLAAVLHGGTIAGARPSPTALNAIAVATLGGRVTSTSNEPLASARVAISELHRTVSTDADGRFRFGDLPSGRYLVSVAALGFKPVTRSVVLAGEPVTLDVMLERALVELPAIQVTATADATAASTAPQPTSILAGDALRTVQAPTLGETLEGLAGVRSLSTGNGIGKPVIRGLTNNSIAVLADGMRLESQQWGFEHGPNIETADVERIEVIRGPGSVLYGTDAIGGVVNVIAPNLPDASGGRPVLAGKLGTTYTSNTRSPEGTAQLEGGAGNVGFRSAFTVRDAGDIRAPEVAGDPRGGRLFNSGLRTYSGTLTAGVRGSWGSLVGSGTYRDERLELHDDDPTATPFQRVGDARAKLEAILPTAGGRVEIMTAFQRNRRREFETASDPATVATGFAERNWSAHVHVHHAPLGKLKGVVGVAGTLGDVRVEEGGEYIIPNSRTWNAGLFAFESLETGRATFSFGARYDRRELTRRPTPELGLTGEDRRTFNALTGSAGVVYRTSASTSLVANVGRGFRAPTPFQLYVNGVHEGTGFFEVGDTTLRVEKSFNTDLALRVQTRSVSADLGVFANFIGDYVFIAPTGTTFTRPGGGAFDIYQTRQGDARLLGFEAAVDAHPVHWLELKATGDLVRGTNTTSDGPLPFIAPFRATYSATLRSDGRGSVLRPYVTLGGESNAAQDRTVAFDTPTAGYTVVNLGGGFAIPTGRGLLHVDLQLRNALNEAYTPFLWRFKSYALFMGRSLITRASLDF